MPILSGLVRRLLRAREGNVAMLFALSLPVLMMTGLGAVDVSRIYTVRAHLQDALDAATLAAARSSAVDDVSLTRIGLTALKANLQQVPQIQFDDDATFTLNQNDVVVADVTVSVKTLVANIVLPPYGQVMDDYIDVKAHSEVDRSSRNVEVSLVLDVTGSMAGSRIDALIEASKDLVDLVVQDVQTPYYSKVALVPYSNSVNPGSYLTAVRGGLATSVDITGAALNLTGTQKTITAATRSRPVVVTSNNHGFANGDVVWISGVKGMTQLNNKAFRVANRTSDTFALYTLAGVRVNGQNYGWFDNNGAAKVQKCQNNDCAVTITTATPHGLANNDYVRLTDIRGMTALNDKTYLVGNVTLNTYTIDPAETATLAPYTSGGRSWCAQEGCSWFAFENMEGDLQTHPASVCVTERTGANRYTDASASSHHVGRHYPAGGDCLDDAILPLTSNASTIKARIDGFEATGGTAGQIGIGWGWYMLSPRFNSIWPSGAAGVYDNAETLKAAVIMTDGEFNTPYASGVISRDAGSGSGGNSAKIDRAPDNADPYTQSRALCDGMKAEGIVIYTVGLGISSTGQAADLLRYCATGGSYFHMADDADDLAGAFKAIGRDITQLRISR